MLCKKKFVRLLSVISNKYSRAFLYYKVKYRFFPRHREQVLRINNVKWKIPDVASFLAMYKEIVLKQIYLFSKKDNNGNGIIIDFGANVGVSLYYFSKKYPNFDIYAFEADPFIFEYLKYNVKQFDNGHIHLFNQAVSDKNGRMEFFSEKSDAGHLVLFDKDSTSDLSNIISVECIDANAFLSRFSSIDMLKIDIEGAERFVLPAIKTQLSLVDNLFFEYHSEANNSQCLVDLLEELKGVFRIYINTGFCPKNPLYQIDSYYGFDSELNIFAKKIDQ